MALLIQDAIFNYVHIKTPVLEFEAKADPKVEHMNKEYVVDVLMPFKAWKVFKKHYKNVGAIKSARTYTAEEYEAAFKVSPPDAKVYADTEGDFTIVKFRQRAYYKDSGDAAKQPRILGTTKVKNGAGEVIGYKDSEGQDVGTDIAVGNGSLGVLQFRERTWTFGGKDGLSLDLVKIQVKNLVAYEAADSDDDFDMDEEIMDDGGSPFAGGADLSGDDEDNSVASSNADQEDDEWA